MKKKSVQVRSFGCSANFGEGEVMEGLLQEQFQHATAAADGDAIVLNLCTVKGDSSALKEVQKALIEAPDRKVIIGGCVTKELAQDVLKIDPMISVTTTHGMDQMEEVVAQTLADKPVFDLSKKDTTRIRLPRVRSNAAIGIVPVCSGCLDRCAFCSTVKVKGKLFSYAEDDIVAEVTELVEDGCKEIWITGQDAACYGFDIGSNLAKLMQKLVRIPGQFWIRVGMGNPRHLREYLPELIEVMKHPKVFKFIHLPVQAGSSKVLEAMKRRHTVEDYLEMVEALRAAIPEMTISTDIIVGHPGEEEEDFLQTLEVMRRTTPSVCNRTRFVPRNGTVAANLVQISKEIKKDRSRRVTSLFKEIALENNQKWVGWKGDIVISEYGKFEGSCIGHNYAYKTIAIDGIFDFGTRLQVEIYEAETFCLLAKIIS